ncbi:hypothetical protein, partial [Paenibacillus tyrfis]|uniref:hypothetical protein n=1 Tax=Paenibacillus tyrfis TaxID=1501230 RepID=UPI0024922C21
MYWGLRYGGSIAIDNIQVTKVNESFESGTWETSNFTLLQREGREVGVGKDASLSGSYLVY